MCLALDVAVASLIPHHTFGVLQGWVTADREKLVQNDTSARLRTCRYPVGSSCGGKGVGDMGEWI